MQEVKCYAFYTIALDILQIGWRGSGQFHYVAGILPIWAITMNHEYWLRYTISIYNCFAEAHSAICSNSDKESCPDAVSINTTSSWLSDADAKKANSNLMSNLG